VIAMARTDPELVAVVGRRFRSEPDGDRGDDAVGRLARIVREERPLMGDAAVIETARALAVDLVGLGAVERLLGDPTVTDVLVNGPGEVWVERAGQLQTTGIVLDRAAVDRAIERLVGPLGLHADRAHPVVDARLADGTRVTAVLPPLAVDGPVLAVRRHRRDPIPLDSLARPDVAALLRERLVGRRNLVVFGATGSGKTTLLASLASELPDHERIITVEDVAELRLPGRGVVRLEARPGGAAGVGRADFRDLVRVALRLRPDRIVVGEVRGAEAADMVWALGTGHDGSMSTVHAPTASDAVDRLTSFAVAGADGAPVDVVRQQVHAALHTLVGVERRPDGRREVASLHDLGSDGRLVPVT